MALENPRQPDKKFTVSVEQLKESNRETIYYERYETIIPVSVLDHAPKNKIACEACHKFGKNFACPPHSPNFPDYLDTQQYAKILCIRMPQEYFRNVLQEKMYTECFQKARTILVGELLNYRKQGFLIAGSSFCLACEVCAAEEGSDKCKKPNKMIYSLESLGVNLTALTKQCFDFDLEWSASEQASDFVCSIGAVFIYENEEIG
ncbi:MAG: hypothetical protein D3916_00580 [Candidatus Electrothrix sp. MAN1_4]|nr:hypothetical protein [Candidatus Electrothrix sp. MAN1_4]